VECALRSLDRLSRGPTPLGGDLPSRGPGPHMPTRCSDTHRPWLMVSPSVPSHVTALCRTEFGSCEVSYRSPRVGSVGRGVCQ
jgi:hypothetical protein